MEAHIPGFLRWVDVCNNGAAAAAAGDFLPLTVDGKTVGYLAPRCRGGGGGERTQAGGSAHTRPEACTHPHPRSFIQRLHAFPDTFQPAADSAAAGLRLHPGLASVEARSAAVARVLQALRSEGVIQGWRDELYPAVQAFHDDPAFLLERAAAPHFGVKAYGVHVNGYVRLPGGGLELWVARRGGGPTGAGSAAAASCVV